MKKVTIRVPATSANLGPGFDAFGCALKLYTDVTFEETDEGLEITGCAEEFTGPDNLGSVTYVAETANGFLALDGNMREIVLWTKDGTYIGTADDGDLFGTNYPWFAHGTQLSDGSILVLMTEERPDRSAMEVLVYQLKGF